jgi:hypothetical protein
MLADADKNQRILLFGEDATDLIRTIKESFGMTLGEEELAAAMTVGALGEVVFLKLDQPASPKCLWAVTFDKVCKAIDRASGSLSRKVSPTAALRGLFPRLSHKKGWREFKDRLNYTVPSLAWPSWLVVAWLLSSGVFLYFLCAARPEGLGIY